MSKYSDPYSRDVVLTILEKLARDSSVDHSKVQELIESTFPGWLVTKLDKYCDDYPHLTSNWNMLCKELKVSPQCIVLVDSIPVEQENTELVKSFSEVMTKNGYVVRRKTEFSPCPVCKAAIPVEPLYNALFTMKNIPGAQNPLKNVYLPSVWSDTCRKCVKN